MMRKSISIILMLTGCTTVVSAQHQIAVDSLTQELREVIVTAKQPATKLVGTTLVSTIAGSNLQNLGTALDVLAQLPMITVADDAVTVVGKGAPAIYIDGRPMRSDDELIHIQSNNIKKVELELAPGAMYSSDTGAVLKIITHRNLVDGLSVIDRGEIVRRRKLSANNMLDLNYRIGPWDVFASGLIARNNSLIKGTTTNRLLYEGKETVVGSSQYKKYPSRNGVVKAGVNYSSGTLSFGMYYRYNPEKGHFSNIGDEWLGDGPRVNRDIYTGIRSHNHRWSMYYDNTFSEKYLLHFDGDFRSSHSANKALTTYSDGNIAEVNSADKRKSTLWAGKLYLSFPFAKGRLTLGTQDSYTHTTLDYSMLNPEVSEYIPSTFTETRQAATAAFASWTRMFGQLNLSAGIRYEYVDYLLKINGTKDKDMSRTDNYLTPDLSISYSFDDESQASISYKMTTVKPPYSQLTGSLSYVGRHEIEGGNPALKDERMHDVQLFGMWQDFMLQADYTRSIDTYAFVKRLYPAPSLQLLMQPVNIDISAIDLYLVWNKTIRKWTPGITLGMHKQWLNLNGTSYNRPIFSYYFDNMISLPEGFLLTLNARGQTKGDIHTNRFGATWFSMDASVSRSFFKKALQLKLSVTDIFNTRNNDWTMNTNGIFVDKRQSYDHRGVSLTLTYRFQPQQSKYKGKTADESEMKRL
ncbi:MAG: outer membrane beta-barrel family protein [Staphylococcus sp.]|nr:outer membrane beta-barrel family protein [Staphylococcus sp.]